MTKKFAEFCLSVDSFSAYNVQTLMNVYFVLVYIRFSRGSKYLCKSTQRSFFFQFLLRGEKKQTKQQFAINGEQ